MIFKIQSKVEENLWKNIYQIKQQKLKNWNQKKLRAKLRIRQKNLQRGKKERAKTDKPIAMIFKILRKEKMNINDKDQKLLEETRKMLIIDGKVFWWTLTEQERINLQVEKIGMEAI